MNKSICCILFVLLPSLLTAGTTYPYQWETSRKQHTLSPEEKMLPEVILKDHLEYAYTFENDQFVMYSVYHRIVRVNSTEAIQRHNRIQINMDRTLELVNVRARSINSSNKVVEFDQTNLKELSNEERGSSYKAFAMEGVELGSEIEYFYIRKMFPTFFSNAYLQMDVPIKQLSFLLKCPRHLEFDFKSYNGFSEVVKDTSATENIYQATMENIPALMNEPFAFQDANKKRIEFKLAYNTARSKARLYTWDDAGKNFYSILFKTAGEDEKTLQKFVNSLKDDPAAPMAQRIRHIERTIKSTIQINKGGGDESLNNLSSIARIKVASGQGVTRMYLYIFSKLNIPVEVVIGCSRERAHFDGSFDSWNYLDEYFLYFPATKGFLSPYNQEVRYPLIEPLFTGQKGLFIEPVEIGNLRSGLASVREIPASSHEISTDNLDITVDFDKDLSGNVIAMTRKLRGHHASYFLPYYHLMTEQQKLTMIDEMAKQTAQGAVISQWAAKPDVSGDVDQFQIDVSFSTNYLVERAGNRILFKAGLVIGPQSELYQDDTRTLAIENTFNRGYERIIRIRIPEGYSIRNAKDLVFDVSYKDGDKEPFVFRSSYEQKGQLLIVRVDEYYKELFAPLERYEDFRKVINAAADFNKVTLVLEKN